MGKIKVAWSAQHNKLLFHAVIYILFCRVLVCKLEIWFWNFSLHHPKQPKRKSMTVQAEEERVSSERAKMSLNSSQTCFEKKRESLVIVQESSISPTSNSLEHVALILPLPFHFSFFFSSSHSEPSSEPEKTFFLSYSNSNLPHTITLFGA